MNTLDADFIDALHRAESSLRAARIPLSRSLLIDTALASRPSSYHLTDAYVSKRLASLRRSRFFERASPREVVRHAIWFDLWAKVKACRRARKQDLDIHRAVSLVLATERPDRFYISPDKALKLFKQYLYT